MPISLAKAGPEMLAGARVNVPRLARRCGGCTALEISESGWSSYFTPGKSVTVPVTTSPSASAGMSCGAPMTAVPSSAATAEPNSS